MAEQDRTPGASPSIMQCMAAALLGWSWCVPVYSLEYQVHGYAAQGFVLSNGNNVFGDSTKGSLSYYEVGINAEMQVSPNLLFAAQGAIRDAGVTDTGYPRLDYAVIDYRFLPGSTGYAGLRVGKVKNPLGFFNETRDVIFTRPSILLPSVYADNQNQRDIIFANPGAQLYGNVARGRHEWSLTGTASSNRNVSQAETRLLITLPVPSSLGVQDSWNGQLMDSIDGGRWQIAYSKFYARLILNAVLPTVPPEGIYGNIGVTLDIFSARYNAEKLSITAEYSLISNKDVITLGGTAIQDLKVIGDTGYLQGDYRINSRWTVLARFDASFSDRGDRSGRDYAAANPGADPASRYAFDVMAGLSWHPNAHWGVWGEYHWVDGSATVQPLENTGSALADHWSMLMLMAGLTF